MTEVTVVCGVGICTLFAAMLLRELRKDWIPALLLGFAVLTFAFVVPKLTDAADFLRDSENPALKPILQALGVTWLTGSAADLCRSAGEAGLAGSIETAGKAELLALSIPLFRELLELSLW